MTISKDEQLRLDAAAVGVDLLWSWAPLIVVCCTMYLCSSQQGEKLHRSKYTHCLGANLVHGTGTVWRQLEAWFQE